MIGVLAFHGDVIEHIRALGSTPAIPVRTNVDLARINALIIPGGESTTLAKLCEREGMWDALQRVPAIFGTCAGAIMLAKHVLHKAPGQKTLELMDITIDRNAYGAQIDSFAKPVQTTLGQIDAIFIRAPKITSVGKHVTTLASDNGHILACEEVVGNQYFFATTFHPELTTRLFHTYFLKKIPA